MKKTLITMGTVALVSIGTVFYTAEPVDAQSIAERKANVEKKLNSVEQEIVKTSEKINNFNEDIGVLENAIKENESTYKKIEKKVNKYKEEIDQLEEEILVLEDGIEKRNEILKNRLSSYQKVGGDYNFIEVILGSVGFESFVSRATAASTIAEADQDLILQQQQAMQEVEEKQNEVEAKLQKQEEEQAKLKEINNKKKKQKEDLEKSKRSVEKEIAKLEDKKAKYIAEGNDIAALEARIAQPAIAATISNAGGNNQANRGSNSQAGSGSKAKSQSSPAPAVNLGGGSNGSAIAAGRSVLGTPYRTAGKAPGGFDCSGFVAWAYKSEGLNLPSYTGALAGVGHRVPSLSQAKPGDLVFFRGGAHVGIYLGNGQFIGSQSSTGVAVANMTSGYWGNTFDGHIRRVK